MRTMSIPCTDLKPSVIGMGGGPLTVEGKDLEVWKLLDTYYELGGSFIDSANIYGKWLPSGQNVCDFNIGKWLREQKVRDQMVITSKGGHPLLSEMSKPRLQKKEVAWDLDESLNALGVDYIDLYYLHRDDQTIPVEEVIDYLGDFVKQGKIRYFGASNWTASRIKAAQVYANQTGKQGFVANQLMWSLATPDMSKASYPGLVSMDHESKQFHFNSGLAGIAYESQA